MYQVDVNWYSNEILDESDNNKETSGFVKLFYTAEPTMRELAQHIRIPSILSDKTDDMISDVIDMNNMEDHESRSFNLDEHRMHFSMNVQKVKFINNIKNEEDSE